MWGCCCTLKTCGKQREENSQAVELVNRTFNTMGMWTRTNPSLIRFSQGISHDERITTTAFDSVPLMRGV